MLVKGVTGDTCIYVSAVLVIRVSGNGVLHIRWQAITWLVVNLTPWKTIQRYLNRNSKLFFHRNAFYPCLIVPIAVSLLFNPIPHTYTIGSHYTSAQLATVLFSRHQWGAWSIILEPETHKSHLHILHARCEVLLWEIKSTWTPNI